MNEEEQTITPSNCRGEFIPPNGKDNINYLFSLVDLNEGTDLEKSFKLKGSSNTNIEFTFDYGNETPSSTMKTYCLPIFLDQKDVKGKTPPTIDLKVSDSNNPTTNTSGTIEPVRTSGLFDETISALQDDTTSHGKNAIRFIILQSETFTSQYFVLIYVKTVVADSRNLKVSTSGNKIKVSYQKRTGTKTTKSTHVVATAAIDSAKDQFTSIVLTDDDNKEHTKSISSAHYENAISL